MSAYPSDEHFGDRNCIGGGGSGAARLSDRGQIVAEVNGCLIRGFSKYKQSGDSLFYAAGPRWTPMATHRWSPFAVLLFGGRKVNCEVDNPERENIHCHPALSMATHQHSIHHSWMGGVENIHPDNGFRVTTEAVLRLGTC